MKGFIVVRAGEMCELFGAYWRSQDSGWELIKTDDIVRFTPEMLEKFRNNAVIIVGDYYENIQDLFDVTEDVQVYSLQDLAYTEYAVKIFPEDSYQRVIYSHLKNFFESGGIVEEAIDFFTGIECVEDINSHEDVRKVIARGAEKRLIPTEIG